MPKRDGKRDNSGAREGLVLLGRIAGAHGIRGEVKINSFTAVPEDIAAYGALSDGKGRTIVIERLRLLKAMAVAAQLAGVADRTAAEALRGVELYIERATLPEPDEDEWYHSDLIGMAAVSLTGESIGTVIAIQDFGAGDLLEIKHADSGQTQFVPFTKEAVPEVDIGRGRVVIAAMTEIEDDRDTG